MCALFVTVWPQTFVSHRTAIIKNIKKEGKKKPAKGSPKTERLTNDQRLEIRRIGEDEAARGRIGDEGSESILPT